MTGFINPSANCPLCPRLEEFRMDAKGTHPGYHNAPVPSFGGLDATHLIVGLAPGFHGANQTGRPFTGDYAGDTLYPALIRHKLAYGEYDRRPDDGLLLNHTRITNAVRCVPPKNKPVSKEITECNAFLHSEIVSMPNLRVILALGGIAHKAVLKAVGLRPSHAPFGHGAICDLGQGRSLLSSYHCSRYNTNTGRLTEEMFDEVIATFANY